MSVCTADQILNIDFNDDLPQNVVDKGLVTKMLFVVGNSRSGTTLLGKILGNHSSIHTFPELQFFEKDISITEMGPGTMDAERLVDVGVRLVASIEDGVFAPVVRSQYEDFVRDIIKRKNITGPMGLYAAILQSKTNEVDKTIFCEHTGRYLFVLERLLDEYPQARAVHIYRDPRAVLLSQKNRWRRARYSGGSQRSRLWTLTSWSNYHAVVTSRLWAAAISKSRTFYVHPRVTEFSYEAMLSEPVDTVSNLCQFIGIEFESAMLDVPVEGSSLRADHPDRRGLDTTRVHGWRSGGLSRGEIEICEKIAGAEMSRLGYSMTGWTAPIGQRALIYASLIPKALAAVALNHRRFSNIFSFLCRRLF